MKRVIFIGNRSTVLVELLTTEGLQLDTVYVLADSFLAKSIDSIEIPKEVAIKTFGMGQKQQLLQELEEADFDILVSNGCPFILPVSKMQKEGQVFVNIHPTLLPELKGKTPLSGVFMTHQPYLGATMHYIDDGIDTGRIIAQERVDVTPDIDQGLVYKISFDLEGPAFKKGIALLKEADFTTVGTQQDSAGSYFNRTEALQTVQEGDTTDIALDKIKSFGIKGQGTIVQLGEERYRVYAAEKITNTYLLGSYKHADELSIAFRYDDKLVLSMKDGMIKLTDYELIGGVRS